MRVLHILTLTKQEEEQEKVHISAKFPLTFHNAHSASKAHKDHSSFTSACLVDVDLIVAVDLHAASHHARQGVLGACHGGKVSRGGIGHLYKRCILFRQPLALLDARLDGRPVVLALLPRSAWHALANSLQHLRMCLNLDVCV